MNYSVRIKQRDDGLIVARIPSLAGAVGYGLDQEEALYELLQSLRTAFRRKAKPARERRRAAAPALAIP